MILDTIEKLNQYIGCCPLLAVAIDFLQENSPADIALGDIQLQKGVWLHTYKYETKVNSNWEAHKKYIDLQYIISGDERISWLPISDAENSKGYDDQKDLEFFAETKTGSENILEEGQFVVFFPTDVHKPSVRCISTYVKKLVFKIPVELNI